MKEFEFEYIASIRGTGFIYADNKEDAIEKINATNRNEFLNNEGISLDIESLNIEDVINVKEIN